MKIKDNRLGKTYEKKRDRELYLKDKIKPIKIEKEKNKDKKRINIR